MDEDPDQVRFPKPQPKPRRPPDWQTQLNRDARPRHDIGQVSDAQLDAEWAAFHLRKRGLDPSGANAAPSEPLEPDARPRQKR